jgi:hypothetical protein
MAAVDAGGRHPDRGVAAMRLLVAALAVLFLLVPARPAGAVVPAAVARLPCADHEALRALLGKRWQERRTAFGLAGNGRLLELYTSPDGTTWTLVAVAPEGRSCIVAAGRGWIRTLPRAGTAEGADA